MNRIALRTRPVPALRLPAIPFGRIAAFLVHLVAQFNRYMDAAQHVHPISEDRPDRRFTP